MESPITTYLQRLHAQISELREGTLHPVRPKQPVINPDDFGIALATVDGYVYEVGTTRKDFSLQSLSKPLSYGLALSDLGAEAVDAKIDVEPSGDPFNEISLDPQTGRPKNAMINAGALAVVSLIKGSGGRSALQRIDETYAAFAGRKLRHSPRAYQAEVRNGDRNHALAYLLSSVGIIESRPTATLETYLRQCTVQVNCRDLAMIAATLANGGTNPVTGAEALGIDAVTRVLSVMLTAGMYDDAGDWVSTVGMPAKSGVGGGVIAVLPGQAGLAVYSPPLDSHGTSVRGVATCQRVSADMQMHFVRSARAGRSAIRSHHTIESEPSTVRRTEEAADVLAEQGHRAVIIELSGDLYFAGTESVVRELSGLPDEVEYIVLDVRRLDEVSQVAWGMLSTIAAQLAAADRRLIIVDPEGIVAEEITETTITTMDSRDAAIAWCEQQVLARYAAPDARPARVTVRDSPALSVLEPEAITALTAMMVPRSYADGEVIRRIGQRFGGVFFILSGRISTIGTDASGGRVALTTLTAGMTFGDLALGEEDRQESTAKADGPVELMLLDAATIEDLEQSDPALAVQLWRALARDAYSHAGQYARTVAARMSH